MMDTIEENLAKWIERFNEYSEQNEQAVIEASERGGQTARGARQIALVVLLGAAAVGVVVIAWDALRQPPSVRRAPSKCSRRVGCRPSTATSRCSCRRSRSARWPRRCPSRCWRSWLTASVCGRGSYYAAQGSERHGAGPCRADLGKPANPHVPTPSPNRRRYGVQGCPAAPTRSPSRSKPFSSAHAPASNAQKPPR